MKEQSFRGPRAALNPIALKLFQNKSILTHSARQPVMTFDLRSDSPSRKGDPKEIPESENEPSAGIADEIVCRQCRHGITSRSQRTVVENAHRHTFANPEGIVFEIGCYEKAWGCSYAGPSSAEFTWFPGYRWRIAVCANCRIHLGWRFSSGEGHFFHGLITDRLSTS